MKISLFAMTVLVSCTAAQEDASVDDSALTVATLGVSGPGTYPFTVASAGTYTLAGNVTAPNDSENSFFIDIDSDPNNSTPRIWDILPLTSTYATRPVSWRGSGTFDHDEFDPNSFALAAGTHTLYIRARETGTLINKMMINLATVAAPSCPLGASATYYVATTGSDSNAGTSAAPFRTITKAYSIAGPGTSIIVRPGTYTDYQSGWGLHLGRSGTASAPIYLCSQARGAAIIDGQNLSDRNQAINIDGSYNVVDGFVITRGPKGGISLWGNGNRIVRNEIHHNGNNTTFTTRPADGQDGVYSSETTASNSYEQNYIHDNGRTTDKTYGRYDHGLYLCGDNENVIDNISVRNAGIGLQIAGYDTVANMKVYNNVFAFNGTSGLVIWQSMSNLEIKNNIVVGNQRNGMYNCGASGTGVVIDHNAVSGNNASNSGYANYALSDQCGGGGSFSYTLGATVASDPMFANATGTYASQSDFQLGTGSPAIDAGLTLSSVSIDIAGNPRPAGGGQDIGAFER